MGRQAPWSVWHAIVTSTHVTVSHTADASEGSVWRECPPIKFFLFLVLKIISEYANIVVVEAAQVINTDVDIINFAV